MILSVEAFRQILLQVQLDTPWSFAYEFNRILRANDSLVCPVRYELRVNEPEEHGSLVSIPKWLDYRCKEMQFFDTIHDLEPVKRKFLQHCLAVLKQQEKENAHLQNQQAHG